MNRDEMAYCLNKQLPTMTAIETDYGRIEITEEMKDAIVDALYPMFANGESVGGDDRSSGSDA